MNQQEIDIQLLYPNPWQTRQKEDPAHIEELAQSIKKEGLMQFPVARPVEGNLPGYTRYQLAFGHSRLAAFKLLASLGYEQYKKMPVNVREMTNEQMAIAAFDENEMRKELNPVEKALAIRKMLEDFGWTQQEVADKLHIDRSTVSNMVRMLRLPEGTLTLVEQGTLPARSAMALLAWYELGEIGKATVHARHGEAAEEFVALARNGEVNSDTIRTKLDEYLGFLTPEQNKIDFDPAKKEEPVIVESDSVQVADELESRSIEADIAAIPDPWESSQGTKNPLDDEMIESDEDEEIQDNVGVLGKLEEPEVVGSTAKTLTDKPAPKPAPVQESQADEPAQESKDTIFSVNWNSGGVIVGLRKPGQTPAVRYMTALTPDEIPNLLSDMGFEN